MRQIAVTSLICVTAFQVACSRSISAISMEYSTITIASDQVADGATPADITLSLRNAMNDPLPGIVMALEVTGSGNVLNSCTTSDSNGRARCRFYSTTAELKRIRVVGSVTMLAETMFVEPPAASSSFGIITSYGDETIVGGQRLVAMSGVVESDIAMPGSYSGGRGGGAFILSSILSSVIGD
jgi:hypothetical protein